MHRYWVRPLILLAALAVIAIVALIQHEQQGGTVYSVRQIVDGAQASPVAWLGRVVLVSGTAVETDAVGASGEGLIDATSVDAASSPYLAVVAGSPDPVDALMRRLPLLQTWLPHLKILDGSGVYRVRLDPQHCGPTQLPPCYVGVLLDAEPGGP